MFGGKLSEELLHLCEKSRLISDEAELSIPERSRGIRPAGGIVVSDE
jgi:hypothetical protein